MPFNVLLLPLLGGYIFVSKWHVTRYRAIRLSGHRLIFWCALCGLVLLAFSLVIVYGISLKWPAVEQFMQAMFQFPYFGTSLGALIIGSTAWYPINRIADAKGWPWSKENQLLQTIKESGNHLEFLLATAMQRQLQVQITTNFGKVYVGLPSRTDDPSETPDYIKIYPILTGYREKPSQRIVFTTDYSQVLSQLDIDDLSHLEESDFVVVIPIKNICAASLWDAKAWTMFNNSDDTPHVVDSPRKSRFWSRFKS